MAQPSDDDTQRLLQLLALKRHEVPPPGFFDRMPSRIIVSIRAGTEVSDRTTWQALLSMIRGEPMIAGSYAALGIGALLFGVSVFQMAVDSDVPALAGPSLAPTAANANSGLFMATSEWEPGPSSLAPSPNLPGGLIFKVTPAAHQRATALGGTTAGLGAPSGSYFLGDPADFRMDPPARVVPVGYTPGAGR